MPSSYWVSEKFGVAFKGSQLLWHDRPLPMLLSMEGTKREYYETKLNANHHVWKSASINTAAGQLATSHPLHHQGQNAETNQISSLGKPQRLGGFFAIRKDCGGRCRY